MQPHTCSRRVALVAAATASLGMRTGIVAAQQQASQLPVVGDWWQWEWSQDGRKGTRRATVAQVSGDRLIIHWGPRDKPPNSVEERTAAFNRLDKNGVPIEEIRHPLSVGAEWQSQFQWTDPHGTSGESEVRRRVLAWERIPVAGAERECLKIEATGHWRAHATTPFGLNGPVSETYWYLPEAKVIAKFQVKTLSPVAGGTAVSQLDYALLRFGHGRSS